jgi:periplasmic protein CpxP/Spy
MIRAILPKALALTVLTAGLSFAGAQQAQPAPDGTTAVQPDAPYGHRHHAPDPQQQAAYLSRRLNLTSDQAQKLEPILATRDQQMQSVWQNQQLAPADRHQQMRSINEQAEQQMAGVLTPDQLTQLKAMRHHGRHHRGDNTDGAQQPS